MALIQINLLFLFSRMSRSIQNCIFCFLTLLLQVGCFCCPTFKEQLVQLKDKDINTYAFLGYPVLQVCDILYDKADFVQLVIDQLPHLELCRELVRRFHSLYNTNIFPEPQPHYRLSTLRLQGLDSRKMSKSYNNVINLDEDRKKAPEVKISSMITDPARKLRQIKGIRKCVMFFLIIWLFSRRNCRS